MEGIDFQSISSGRFTSVNALKVCHAAPDWKVSVDFPEAKTSDSPDPSASASSKLHSVCGWALPGQEGYMHILGGLEKDSDTGAISTEPENHNLMCRLRAEKIAKIPVPDVKVQGCVEDADLLLIVGLFGGTFGSFLFSNGGNESC